MFSRPAKQTVRVGLLTAWLLLAACFPPALQPTPIAVEQTVIIAPLVTPVPTLSPTPMVMPSWGEPLSLGRELHDNVYAPGALFYARPRTESPNIMRAIEVRDWQTGNVVAQAVYGSDIFRINWSPDGHWLAAQATDGTIKVWPVHW